MKKMISIIIALLMVAMGTVAFAEAVAPTNAGILRISVSASDLATTAAFFDDVMEMNRVAEGELDKATVKALYNMDATAKYAMFKNAATSISLTAARTTTRRMPSSPAWAMSSRPRRTAM